MRRVNVWTAAIGAAINTLIVRFSVYGDDCNLVVVGMTYLVAFIVVYVITRIARKGFVGK